MYTTSNDHRDGQRRKHGDDLINSRRLKREHCTGLILLVLFIIKEQAILFKALKASFTQFSIYEMFKRIDTGHNKAIG